MTRQNKRVSLTCKCGTQYTLNTIHDLWSRCINERCRATLNMDPEALWKYQESIIVLMAALELERDYARELDFAERMSRKFASAANCNR